MKLTKTLLLALCLQAPALFAQEEADAPAVPEPTPDCEEAVTVFQDVSRVGRKDRAAGNISKRHAEMAQDGWRFIDMEVYSENGDLEGFYLSYVRTKACTEATADGG